LPATPETVHWGFFDRDLPPVLRVRSGDLIQVETVTHRAGDAPDLLMDAGVAAIFERVTDRGPGGHIMTGPIQVEGAEPGDALEMELLSLTPRLGYGSNRSAAHGYLWEELGQLSQATIFELNTASGLARPLFRYPIPWTLGIGERVDVSAQAVVNAPRGIAVPLRLHLGIAAVAPEPRGKHSSTPPGRYGGNIDNWRIGAGAKMYYPVLARGAIFSVGDPHAAQGDAELDGTAVEASLNVLLRLRLHKQRPINNPLLETPTHWITHGFDPDLNVAMRQSALEMLDLLVGRFGLEREDAYALMSVGVDFAVTQVVDERRGVHASLAKSLFRAADAPHRGTS
jgi:acetamidase/formamidase